MRRIINTILVCVFILSFQSSAWAGKIVVLLSRALLPYEQAWQGFVLAASGLTVEKTDMQGDLEKGKQLLGNMSPDSVDLVVTIGSEATLAAQKSAITIPVVYTMVLEEPQLRGKIGGGILMQVKTEKQLEIVIKLLPKAKTIGVIYNMHYTSAVINQAREIAKGLNVSLSPIAVESQTDIPSALQKITADKIDVLWSVIDPTVAKPESIQLLIAHTLKEKIPFIALSPYHVKAGAFAALSIDYKDLGGQTADLAMKILKTKTSQSAEYPRRVVLCVNVDTQKKLGIQELPSLPGVQIVTE